MIESFLPTNIAVSYSTVGLRVRLRCCEITESPLSSTHARENLPLGGDKIL